MANTEDFDLDLTELFPVKKVQLAHSQVITVRIPVVLKNRLMEICRLLRLSMNRGCLSAIEGFTRAFEKAILNSDLDLRDFDWSKDAAAVAVNSLRATLADQAESPVSESPASTSAPDEELSETVQ